MKKDLYAGLKVDYREDDVTPQNFLNLIKGNASGIVGGNGRILKSGPKDRVFIYFVDHGGAGVLYFQARTVTTKELNEALLYAAKNDRFGQLVFYLEACESGSMFEGSLPSNLNIYAVTAANGTESSFPTYCDVVEPHQMPCLGDVFSVSWMEDSNEEKLATETIRQQFELVKKETSTLATSPLKASPSAGSREWEARDVHFTVENRRENRFKIKDVELRHRTAWPSFDIELMFLKRKLHNDVFEAKKAVKRINEIKEQTFKKLVYQILIDGEGEGNFARNDLFAVRHPILLLDCHNDVVHAFEKICIDFGQVDYALKYAYVLNNLCVYMDGNADSIIRLMVDVCI